MIFANDGYWTGYRLECGRMTHAVKVNILEKMREVYGEEFVELIDGKIYVTDEDTNACCEIQVILAE